MTGEKWAAQTSFVSKIRGVLENWYFLNLLSISVALKVIKKGRTVPGRSFHVESNDVVSFFLFRLVSDI